MQYILLATLLIAVGRFSASAGERTDFMVNDDGGHTVQNNPRIAVSGDHTFVITWVDKREGTNDIYVQRFGANGLPVGRNRKINDDTNASYQFEPAIAVDLSGLFSVVWRDYRNGTYPFDPDIYFQRFDSSLTASGVNRNLTTEWPDSTKETPDIALGPHGKGVVVWADYRNQNWDIYGQLIDPSGALIGSNFMVNDDAGTSQQHAPRVAISPQGWFVVTWYDNRMGNDDIFVRRYDSLGNPLSANIKVNTDSQSARQAFPDVATDAAGHFTVVWVDWRNGVYPANPDIYAKKYDVSMTSANGEIRINTDLGLAAQREPSIASDRMGNVAIIWSDSASGSWDISGQMIDADGIVREANFTANSYTDSLQLRPDVALDGVYRYITWSDNRNGNLDIYASIQKYNDPSLWVTPTSLAFQMQWGSALPETQQIIVSHSGYNPLHFSAHADVSWLTINPSTGTTTDTLDVSVNDNSLSVGTHLAVITLVDTDSHDSSLVLSVRLDVHGIEISNDTLKVLPTNVLSYDHGNTSIVGVFSSSVSGILLPLHYDTSAIRIDSVTAGLGVPSQTSFSWVNDSVGGILRLEWTVITPGVYFSLGEQHLAEMYFTAKSLITTVTIDTLSNDSLALSLTVPSKKIVTSRFVPGQITISPTTDVDNPSDNGLPGKFLLGQNSPNPFNLSTTIRFELPRSAQVTLELFNIIGQRVIVLEQGELTAGEHVVSWDGRFSNGSVAPSGIYFYRLRAGSISLVRKMLMLK